MNKKLIVIIYLQKIKAEAWLFILFTEADVESLNPSPLTSVSSHITSIT